MKGKDLNLPTGLSSPALVKEEALLKEDLSNAVLT